MEQFSDTWYTGRHFPTITLVHTKKSGLEIENTAVGISHADHVAPSFRER
jgi:hypothetical protein